MRNKMKKSLLTFIVLAIVLVPSCFAATVLEDTADYTEGAIIYGSTRFETDVIITAGEAFNAGINESKVWVALGNKLNDLEPVTPYFYDGASWYKIVNDEENPAVPVTEAEDIKEIEDSLHIFFVNNKMKTVEVPYDGNVDEGSVTEGAVYDEENKKFIVPALSFDFEFTDDGAKVEVNTNVDTNTEVTDPEDIVEPEIINSEVAAIGDVKYEDLHTAVEAAKANDTVKLLANIELTSMLVVKKAITLDLNGKTITVAEDMADITAIQILEGGDLVITGNGTVNSATQGNNYSIAVWAKETGKATIKNGTFTNVGAKDKNDVGKENNNEMIYVSGSGVITIEGGTYIGNTENEVYGPRYTLNSHDASYTAGTANIIVKGGTYTAFDPSNNLAEGKGTNFVAEGYKVVKFGDKYTVVAYDANNVTTEAELRYFIANGTDVKLGADIDLVTGIEVAKKVTVNLNGKTLTAKKDTEGIGIFMVVTGGDLTIEGDGKIDSACLTNDYSMAVWVKETGKLTINGGTYTNLGAKDMEDDGKTANNNEVIYVRDNGSAVINGGTFIGNTSNKTYGAGFTLNLRDQDRATASIVVKGGTFTGFNPADNAAENAGTNFVAEGYKVVKSGDKYTVVAYDANNVVSETELRYFIANGTDVKLGADIDLTTGIEVAKKVTVNLNGKTLTAKKDTEGIGIFMVVTGGDLTIEGDGKIDSACLTNDYSMAIWVKETGKLTVNGGTFTNVGAKDMEDDGKTANNNEVIYVRDNGSAVINGGTFIGNTSNKTYGAGFTLNLRDQDRATASIVVKGGTFTGFNPADNAAENAGTNFVAEGYRSVYNEAENTYTVKAYDINNVDDDDSLKYALANAKDGDTINLAAGNYSKVLIDHRKNVAKNITLVGTEGVKIAGVNMNGANYGFAPEGLTFKNITFTDDVNVNNTDKWGVCKNLSIIGCTFTNAAFTAGNNSTFDGLRIENNKFNGTNTTNKTSILLQGEHTNVLVKGNTIDGSVHNAVQLAGITGKATIEGNTIKNIGSRAIRISTATGAELTISNNIISNVNTDPAQAAENNGQVIKITGTVTVPTAEGNTYNGKALTFVDGIAVAPVEE